MMRHEASGGEGLDIVSSRLLYLFNFMNTSIC